MPARARASPDRETSKRMFRLGLSARLTRNTEVRARLKAQVARVLGLGPDVVVSITEISCSAAGCPDGEIVILILRQGEPPQAGKLHGRMEGASDDAIRAAFAAQMGGDERASA